MSFLLLTTDQTEPSRSSRWFSSVSNRWPFVLFLVIAVRFGRVPKREKARILAAMQQSSHSRSQEKAVAAELEDEQRLLATVVQAHLDTCDFTRDKVAPILVRARETPNYTACPPTLVSIYTLFPRKPVFWHLFHSCSLAFCTFFIIIFFSFFLYVRFRDFAFRANHFYYRLRQ